MIEKVNISPIGVIGLGNLGKTLVTQIVASDQKTLTFDRSTPTHTDVDTILQNCQIVHWAVASRELDTLPQVPEDCTVILHDSVMNNSHRALACRPDSARFVIAHYLMNEQRRVLVSTGYGDFKSVKRHFRTLGLVPKNTTVTEHDTMMARTQGIFALLLKVGLREQLDHEFEQGNLTPSAMELRAAVIHREASWTEQTLQSILSNPQLVPLVHDMLMQLRNDTTL